MSNKERGNILFIILIAVVLFAALSYAVTYSNRGNGKTINKEKAEILSARLMQMVSNYKNVQNRLTLIGHYDQVLYNNSAATDSGTCYLGKVPTTPCRTIGIFSPEAGLTPFNYNAMLTATPPDTRRDGWQSSRALAGGQDIGTSLPDDYLIFDWIDKTICEAINKKLTGSTAIPAFASATDAQGMAWLNRNADGTFNSIATIPNSTYDFGLEAGCISVPSQNFVFIYPLIIR